MIKTTTSLLTVALAGAVSLATATDTRAASLQVLMNDDYSSGSVTGTGNFYAQNIDDNSHFKNTASGWTISGGTLQNTGDADNVASEGAVTRGVSVGSATGQTINVSFDYTLTSASESLSVFLIGMIGSTIPTYGTSRIGNFGHIAADGSGRHQYLELDNGLTDPGVMESYELLNGDLLSDVPPDGYLGENGLSGVDYSYFAKLTGAGSGTYSTTIDLASLGFTDVSDFDYLQVIFARDAVAGSGVTIDNLLLTVPEPSSTALLGLGGLALMLRRKRS
jgi:hypothetical protein